MSRARRNGAALVLLGFLLAGCAVTYHVRPGLLPAESTVAMVPQWPLKVGVYVAPSVRTMVFARALWRVPVGNAVASSFRWAVGQMFADVTDVDAPSSSGSPDPRLAGIIALTRMADEGSARAFGSLRYEIALYSNDGKEIDRWTLGTPTTLWDTEASSSLIIRSVASDIGYEIRNETAQFMGDFTSHAAVRAWLSGRGIKDPVVRPTLRAARPPFRGTGPGAIVVVPDLRTWSYTDSGKARSCIGGRLAAYSPPLELLPIDRIRMDFFPWLEPAVAPKSRDGMQRWLHEEAVQAQLRASGIRYFLEFRGGTKMDMKGAILCPYGCLGFMWGSRQSSFSAYLVDVQISKALADETVVRRGRVFVPAFLLPVPLIAATKSAACQELAERIHAAVMRAPGP